MFRCTWTHDVVEESTSGESGIGMTPRNGANIALRAKDLGVWEVRERKREREREREAEEEEEEETGETERDRERARQRDSLILIAN